MCFELHVITHLVFSEAKQSFNVRGLFASAELARCEIIRLWLILSWAYRRF